MVGEIKEAVGGNSLPDFVSPDLAAHADQIYALLRLFLKIPWIPIVEIRHNTQYDTEISFEEYSSIVVYQMQPFIIGQLRLSFCYSRYPNPQGCTILDKL